MTSPNSSSKVFLAVLSMVVAVVTWSVICYSFVVNCVLILSVVLSSNDNKSSFLDDLGISVDNESLLAAVIVFYSLRLVCEIVSCILLVIQFLSSYEFTLCSDGDNETEGYEKNWRRCHQNVLFWSLGIFAITMCSALTGMSPILFFEITMLALNLVFLLVFLLFQFLIDENTITYEDATIDSRNTNNYIENQNYQDFPEKTPAYNISVNSFVEKSNNNSNEKSNDLNMLV